MGYFKNATINSAFDIGIINFIIAHLAKCSKQMKADCVAADNLLKNDEDAITNRLIAVYLNAEQGILRYEAQSPEHYDCETERYIGRADIKVITRDYFRDEHAYHIVECKRIDGTNTLNKKYITEGVARFFSPMPIAKYSSYYTQNIMFGYVVKPISIPDNTVRIDKLQQSLLKEVTAAKFALRQSEVTHYFVYTCDYFSDHTAHIELSHLFFNFSDAVCGE